MNQIHKTFFLATIVLAQASVMAAQSTIDLGEAGHFAVLAASDITSVPPARINGDVGISPAARSKIAGLTPVEVIGTIFAADDGGATAVMLTKAQNDLTTAYNDAAGRSLGAVLVNNADLGGLTLPPGLYKSSGTLGITGNLTLDANGDATAVFIFQVATVLTTGSGAQVILAGGANPDNIFWQVGTEAKFGTTTKFKGTIMADQSISMATGGSLDGRALARIGAVTLESNAIIEPRLLPLAVRFGPTFRANPNSVTLTLTNTPGRALTIQYSSNLTTWIDLATPTFTVSPQGYVDITASAEPKRFYRAFYP